MLSDHAVSLLGEELTLGQILRELRNPDSRIVFHPHLAQFLFDLRRASRPTPDLDRLCLALAYRSSGRPRTPTPARTALETVVIRTARSIARAAASYESREAASLTDARDAFDSLDERPGFWLRKYAAFLREAQDAAFALPIHDELLFESRTRPEEAFGLVFCELICEHRRDKRRKLESLLSRRFPFTFGTDMR